MSKAYNIANVVKVHDQEKFREYVVGHIPSIEKFGGKFLTRGQLGEVLEGAWESNVMVVHEFPSVEQFKEWYYSDDYRPWKALRQSCADVNVILVEGV